MTAIFQRISPAKAAFWAVFTVAVVFALYTQHAWEDYWITFRSSKNLATGHGLVYNVGDRLHTFTSPLGVLLPALASLLTANSSDPAALWIFRLMCAAALGGAAVLLVRIAQRQNYGAVASFILVAWLALDAKIIDFTINGMETGFMILFLVYALWAHLGGGPAQWRHLGAAWAGLMWTRPDSFIYIGLIAAGFWLFNDVQQSGTTRTKLLGLFLKAGLLTTALYLPWLVSAHLYYGTAVPHTITAKSGIGDPHTLAGLLDSIWHLPMRAWDDMGSMKGTFLPAYHMIGGWPAWLGQIGGGVAVVISLLWLLPFLRTEARACSFAFFGAHAYLSYFPYFPFPWYLPSTTLLGIIALGSLLAQVLQAMGRRTAGRVVIAIAALFLAGAGWTTWQVARQLQAQQQYVEDGNRRKIGEWLHANAAKGDTVFMEPLGYIGYFSQLKTYDFPGMSSREMVQTRQQVGLDWSALIEYLQPNWLVLRPDEARRINNLVPDLLITHYTPTKEFSVVDEISRLGVLGRRYLEIDSKFTVYCRVKLKSYRTDLVEIVSGFDVAQKTLDGNRLTLVHAPGRMIVKVPLKATTLDITYGFPEGAYTGEGDPTDGATFQIVWENGDRKVTLLDTTLNPVANPAHRGMQHFHCDLPAAPDASGRLIFRTLPGATTTKDWTCWSRPDFQ
ncbi:MAG: hypothetical protein HYX71_06825 [Opitutae bacterium]|nr:hypothetical protein [Opitutae bacterium]